jgi:hypothetical protein
MRKLLVGFALLLVISFALFLHFRKPKGPPEIAYAGNRDITLWSTSAQVREAVGTLNYGDRLEVLERSQDQVHVRTAAGLTGWTTDSELLSADLWERAKTLDTKAASMPVEARGHTAAISNLHVDPARDSVRIRQLGKDTPLDLFQRQVSEVKSSTTTRGVVAATDTAKSAGVRKEDWWLVRAHLADQSKATGWILGRFIDLDVPAPLPDYASSAGMHIVAWFELNHVLDDSGASKPQYLLLGNKGSEGQPCDFTLMRVYTWGKQKQRYETAYVESDVCGKLPLDISEPKTPGGDARFSFEDISTGAREHRAYYMHQTIVRRENGPRSGPIKRKHAHARK